MASVRHSVHNEIAALGLGQKAFHAADAETALDHAAEPLHFGDHGGNLLRFRDARANRSFQGFDIHWPVTTTRHTSAVSCSKRITTVAMPRGLIRGFLFLVNPFNLEREISPLIGCFGNGSWLNRRCVAFLVCGATGFLATAAAIQ